MRYNLFLKHFNGFPSFQTKATHSHILTIWTKLSLHHVDFPAVLSSSPEDLEIQERGLPGLDIFRTGANLQVLLLSSLSEAQDGQYPDPDVGVCPWYPELSYLLQLWLGAVKFEHRIGVLDNPRLQRLPLSGTEKKKKRTLICSVCWFLSVKYLQCSYSRSPELGWEAVLALWANTC